MLSGDRVGGAKLELICEEAQPPGVLNDEDSEGWGGIWMRNLVSLVSDPGSVTCQVPLVRQVTCFLEPGLFHLLPGVRTAIRICATKDTWAL